MPALLGNLFPLLYAACFLLLLWQAFRIMSRGFGAATTTVRPASGSPLPGEDRTGRLTIHPELLDADGQLTQEDLLTVRFSADNGPSRMPGDPG